MKLYTIASPEFVTNILIPGLVDKEFLPVFQIEKEIFDIMGNCFYLLFFEEVTADLKFETGAPKIVKVNFQTKDDQVIGYTVDKDVFIPHLAKNQLPEKVYQK